MPSKDPLPSKENTLFKKILKCYEIKQYRQGLKLAKQILGNPKFAEHGETLAMKGLILNCLNKKEEAYDHVRRGLRNDLTSHVCWHVFGLLQRSDRKYDEAIKAYRNALRWDKDNLQIMRDLSLLQIQMRDYEGYRETRNRLLELRPGQRASWIGYAMSWHLLKDYEMALCVMEEFRKTLDPKSHDYEYSELVLYQCSIMEEAGRVQDAVTFIEKCGEQVVDKLYYEETRARLYYQLGDYATASKLYRGLLERNSENLSYYHGLEKALQLQSVAEKLAFYKEYREQKSSAAMPRKIPLSYATGDSFRSLADEFLKNGLRKGVPSLFMNMKPFYGDQSKVSIIEQLVLGYNKNLTEKQLFTDSPECSDVSSDELEPPTTLLWTQVFIAQHYERLGNYNLALEYINKSVSDTPTLPELHMIKGRIYKHAGNVYEAYKCLDEAQSLDTADRYINCKCAKLMLRNNLVKDAEIMCQQFTREGIPAADNLNEMQCMWFQTECAAAYARKREWGNALKLCHQIDKHFTEMTEDQFDFHTYCLRKLTLRAYVSLLRLEDVLRNHRFYFKAASTAIKIYLHLHSHPVVDGDVNEGSNPDNLSASDLKKLRNKQRKAQKKAAAANEKAAEESVNKPKAANERGKGAAEADAEQANKVDDFLPSKLERCSDPLEQAVRFLVPLQTLCGDKIQSHIMAYEIYSRKLKPLLMLKAIKGGSSLKSDDPKFHVCMVKFLTYVKQAQDLAPAIKAVLDQEVNVIYGNSTAEQFNTHFLSQNHNSVPHRLAAAQVIYVLDQSRQTEAVELACCLDGSLKSLNHLSCSEVLDSLSNGDLGNCVSYVDEYKRKCHELFPYATVFMASEEISNGTTGAIADRSDPVGLCSDEH